MCWRGGKAAAEKRADRQREIEDAQRQKDTAAEARAAKRDAFRQRFLALAALPDTPQQRGYELEVFLNEFMEFDGLSPRGSFKIVGEQIDGSFSWNGYTSLVEAKWITSPVDGSSFGAFTYKLDGKTANTRGLFLSINGYSKQAIAGLNSKGSLRFVCIDGTHLMRATEFGWDFPRLLRSVWRHADETGEAYLPVGSPHFIARGG